MRLVCVALFVLIGYVAADLAVKIDRHFPCNSKTGPSKENLRIKFPSYKQAGVKFTEERDSAGNKCYRMSGGTVKIYSPGLDGNKKYYVHVETRIGINGKPERCINADKDGCGGIGSCVHCDICHDQSGLKNFVQIFKGNKLAQCNAESMAAGDFNDVSLRVCLPNKSEMMAFLDKDPKRAEEMWQFLMNSRGKSGELPLVIVARLYDRPINKLSAAELKDAISGSKNGEVGCHAIYASAMEETVTASKTSKPLKRFGCYINARNAIDIDEYRGTIGGNAKAGLETTNLIFGIDYTASNKYQGEHSFDGRALHFLDDPTIQNPYQSVIQIMGRSLAPFTSKTIGIPVYGFGDNESGDWGVFPLNGTDGICRDLDEVLRVYNKATPNIALAGPTNFAPLIYQAIQHCQRFQDYHILIISCDGQVTNERATRKAIVQACQFPLSIIVVGVGDGPWEMMRVFDESLPKRSWDNFHFVEFREVIRSPQDPAGELAFAIQTLLEVPDQYHHIRTLGMLPNKSST